MKSLTNQLFEESLGIIRIQTEVSDSEGLYHMADDGGCETEVGDFLYGLTKILKPKNVLTTGVYSGISDMYISQALEDNVRGTIWALEYEQAHINRARVLWEKTGLQHRILAILTNSLDYKPDRTYQLMFLDTEPGIRFAELVKFFPYLDEGGYVGIHDLPNNLCQGNFNPDHPEMRSYPYGDLPDQIIDWLKTDKLRMIHFPSPRGLTFFYKPKEGDYRP